MTESAHRARSIWNAPPLRHPHSRNIRKGWNSVQLSTPKQVQTQETKQKIYKAASSILKKKGYAYLTVSNICAVAGVSNGTFFYHFKTKDELLVYYNYQKFAEFREKNNFGEAVAGKTFDERILLFYYYWSDYMLDVGLDFCCNYYNTKNTSIDTRRWHQRQPAYVWGYPDSCLQEAAEQNDPRTRTLRIGCFASIARARLPELLRAFRAEHPEIQLDVLVRSEELTTALASGRIQLALVDEARAKGFDFQPLADAPLVAAVPPDFPWEGETIPLERLLREPFLSSPDQYIEPFLPPDTPRLEVTASDDGSILSMVAGGLGVSVLSSFSLVGYEGQVRVLQLEKPIALRLGAAVKSVNTIGTSARMFLTFLREYYGKDDTQ